MRELKNCPFCGGLAVRIKNNVGVNYITCSNTYEQSKGDCVYDLRVNPGIWNMRAGEAEIAALKEREAKLIELIGQLSKVRLYNSANIFKGPMIRDKALVHDLVLKARKVMKDLDIEL